MKIQIGKQELRIRSVFKRNYIVDKVLVKKRSYDWRKKMGLKEQIENYVPYNEQEKADKEIMLNCIDGFEDVLTRDNKLFHFTASNWIVNKKRTKVLMIYHNIY